MLRIKFQPNQEAKQGDASMNRRFATLSLLATLLLACASSAFAQDTETDPSAKPEPRFTAVQHPELASPVPGKQLVQWNGSFTDLTHVKRTFTMAGTNPSTTDVTTTFTVWVIPVKFVYNASHGNKTFDPNKHKLSNGRTVTQNTLKSPLFNAGIDFKQGATDLGNTQYIDAFQRGTWWGKNVKKNNKYHVLLKTVLKPEQTINCTDASCQVDTFHFGTDPNITAGLADINYYDNLVQGFMTKLGATPDIVPLFIWNDVYLTSGGIGLNFCCIGGYHGANGPPPASQTYTNAAYADVKTFSQDVSAMSHELGEWMDNPFFGTNTVGCTDNSQLEVGDPLEGGPNYGAFPYKLNGFTYNLQSLVWIGYFGAPRSDSANKWLAFQNDEPHVCPGQ
jgi:hypothetical protein